MQGRVVITLAVLLAVSHDVVRSERVRKIPTIAALSQERAGSPNRGSDVLTSMRDAEDGEYVIFNSKGDPEAAVVVTKDAAKATEESNIRSIYEWMQRYIDNHNTPLKTAVSAPSAIAPKASSPYYQHLFPQPSYPQHPYAAGYYGYPSYAQHQYSPYTPVAPYNPYSMASYPNAAPYRYGVSQGYSQGYYPLPRDPQKVQGFHPFIDTVAVTGGAQQRPVHVYRVTPAEYARPVASKAPKVKKPQAQVVLGAHTTPNGRPWPPARKVQKNKGHILEQEEVSLPLGFTRYVNVASEDMDEGQMDAVKPQQVNQNLFYRSWLAGQSSVGGESPVNYDDEALSAYLLSKFAPFVQPQAYRVKSVAKGNKKNNAGVRKAAPTRYYTRGQIDELINGKRYESSPEVYSLEATPAKIGRYGLMRDAGYRFRQDGGLGNQGYAAVQGLNGYTETDIDEMIDAGRGNDYLHFYSPQDVQTIAKKYAKLSAGYGNKNRDVQKRRGNIPQLYLFPDVEKKAPRFSLYGGGNDEGVDLNGYMDVIRNIKFPPRYQMQAPVFRQISNQGYRKEAMGDEGRNVDYRNLFDFMRGMNGVTGKSSKTGQRFMTRNVRPQYYSVDEDDDKEQEGLSRYTKSQIAQIIANNLRTHRDGGARNIVGPSIEPWGHLRNSEISYLTADQPWRRTFAQQQEGMGYGY